MCFVEVRDFCYERPVCLLAHSAKQNLAPPLHRHTYAVKSGAN